MAAPKPGILHGLYTEQDIEIKFRCNHALQNLNLPVAHEEHKHLAFIIIFEHQKREELRCSENIHLLSLIASAADYQKRQPCATYTLSAPPLFGLPVAPEWPGPSPFLKGYLVPVFLEKTDCSPASASRDRMFEYLGYHRIVSIKYCRRSSSRSLVAQELWEMLHKRFGERFHAVLRSSPFPIPRLPRELLSRMDIGDAILTIESAGESEADEDAIPKQEGSRSNGCVKAVIKEEREDGWDMMLEAPTMRLTDLLDREGWMIV